MQVTITSAQKLSKQQLSKLQQALEKKYGTELIYTEQIDKKVIGGLKVTIGSREIDATIKNKLQQLRKQMLTEATA